MVVTFDVEIWVSTGLQKDIPAGDECQEHAYLVIT